MFARDGAGQWVRVNPEAMARYLQRGDTSYRLEQVKPDVRVLTDALDRLFGKPAQMLDVRADVQTMHTTVHEHHHSARCPVCGVVSATKR